MEGAEEGERKERNEWERVSEGYIIYEGVGCERDECIMREGK